MRLPGGILRRLDRLVRSAERRPPDFTIAPEGHATMERWHLLKSKLFNVYVHRVVGSDDRRALHDHPFASLSIILRGSYCEVMPLLKLDGTAYRHGDPVWWHVRREGDVTYRGAKQAHAICLDGGSHWISQQPCWSLFITGPSYRKWGFHCAKGWVDERFYRRRVGNTSEVGNGCS